MSGPYDPTCIPDPADAIEPEVEWQGEIPVDGAVMPEGITPDAMDAEIMPFSLWIGIYREEPWSLEPARGFWEEYS